MKTINRRNFLRAGGAGVVAAAATITAQKKETDDSEYSLKGKKLGMVIDLMRCTGCGGCAISCKIENNVQDGIMWARNVATTTGTFPNVRFESVPTLCNHCEKAPCVKMCPTKAMHKGGGNITLHDSNRCIGCKGCVAACPYNVISVNHKKVHKFWNDDKALIKGCTSPAKDVVNTTGGKKIPYYNPSKEGTCGGAGVRYKGIVEKCTFCDHRLKHGKRPYCVDRCPSGARIFGDLNDPNSEVRKQLGKHYPRRLKEHLGTEPKVFYIREFNPAHSKKNRGSV